MNVESRISKHVEQNFGLPVRQVLKDVIYVGSESPFLLTEHEIIEVINVASGLKELADAELLTSLVVTEMGKNDECDIIGAWENVALRAVNRRLKEGDGDNSGDERINGFLKFNVELIADLLELADLQEEPKLPKFQEEFDGSFRFRGRHYQVKRFCPASSIAITWFKTVGEVIRRIENVA